MKTLGHYELTERLGRGGMGIVYRARHRRLGRSVALKVLAPEIREDPGKRARFEREAKAAAAVNDPNVATLFEYDEAVDSSGNRVLYLTMEFVPGEDLTTLVKRGPMALHQVLDLGTQIASGLSAAHRLGIIHRDLKPGNIRITPEGRAKILDLGLVKFTPIAEKLALPTESLKTESGAVMGTPAYMAAEQFTGQQVSEKTDLFALGVILYELLAGERPFQATTLSEQIVAVVQGKHRPILEALPGLDGRVAKLIDELLSPRPEKRPGSAATVLQRLRQLRRNTSDDTTEAYDLHEVETVHDRVEKATPKMSRGVLAVAAISLAAAIVASVGYMISQESEAPAGIAVFPFQNNSGDPELESVARGLGEALENELSRQVRTPVLSQTIAASFEESEAGQRRLIERYRLRHLVEGQVRVVGNTLTIDLRLVDIESGVVVWAGTLAEPRDALYRIEARMANLLCQELAVCSGSVEGRTESAEAYSLYLEALPFLPDGRYVDSAGLDTGIALLQDSIEADPGFSKARSELAKALHLRGRGTDRADAILEAEMAVRLDDSDLGAKLTLARLYRAADRFDEAAATIAQVRTQTPELSTDGEGHSGDVSEWSLRMEEGLTYELSGSHEEAEKSYLEASRLNEEAWQPWHSLAILYMTLSRFTEAEAAVDRAELLAPEGEDLPFQTRILLSYYLDGIDAAIDSFEQYTGPRTDPTLISNMGTMYWLQGQYERSLELFNQAVLQRPSRPILHGNLGDALMKLGRPEEANRRYNIALGYAQRRAEAQPEASSLAIDVVFYQAKAGRCQDVAVDGPPLLAIDQIQGFLLPELAKAFALCGLRTEAYEALERARQMQVPISRDWEFEDLFDEPRFESMVQATGPTA